MAKGILIKAPDLFTVDEQLDIQEQFKSDDIEIAFLKGDQIQASFNSFIEMLINNDFLNDAASHADYARYAAFFN